MKCRDTCVAFYLVDRSTHKPQMMHSYGLCVWSTGVGPTPFVTSLPFAKTPKGRLAVDEFLRLAAPPMGEVGADGQVRGPGSPGPGPSSPEQVAMTADEEPSGPQGPWHGCEAVPGVYALGDCCANVDAPLPALAQVGCY